MAKLDWFEEARYGMFVHWGPYSVAARGEWVANRECIPQDEYTTRYVDPWQTERYDPAAWAELAVAAGMKYIVLTTKHHDGFCLWPTGTTDFHAGNHGPRRDLLAPFVEAARAAGLRVGFYLSGAEWFHPDYPDPFARDWPTAWPDPDAHRRLVDHVLAQVEELLTRYGTIDLLWWDGCLPEPFDPEGRINRRALALQPDILLNERNGAPFDFRCSEQSTKEKDGPWESCMTLNRNWGYHAGDSDWKDARDVILTLIGVAGKGGNLLMNVGPTGDGTIPPQTDAILRKAGAWLRTHGEWLPRSGRQPFTWNNTSLVTVRGETVYLHLIHGVEGKEYCWAELANPVRSARLVSTGDALPFEKRGARLFLRGIPSEPEEGIATTIALELEGEPAPLRTQETFWIPE